MANAYTDITSGASLGTNLVKTAYDKLIEFQLRSLPWYRSLADKRIVDQTQPGTSVVFNLYQDLAKATGTLNEIVDPDAVAIPQTTQVTVTLNEYGNAALVTRKLRMFALSDVDAGIADILAFNMRDSLDDVVKNVLMGGTQVVREVGGALKPVGAAGSTTGAVTATDTFKSRDVRASVAKLRANSVMPRIGDYFSGYMHPDVAYDLRSETTNADWRTAHQLSGSNQIWGGTVGEYEGVVWVETPRSHFANDGTTAAKVHRTVIAGKQALAEAVAEEPHVIVGPVTDKLMRFRSIGWYGVLGWSLYRDQALVRVETSSSLG